MAFADVLQRIGRIIGLYSEDDTGYDEQEGEYIQQEPPEYDQPEQPVYTTMGMNGSYTSSGARPKPQRGGRESARQGWRIHQAPSQPRYAPDNVIPMPEREDVEEVEPPLAGGGRSSTIIFCVRRKDDSSQIINYLLTGVNVILNFEELDDGQVQRVLDMVSGAAFALRGTVERISHRNYLVAPTGVEIVRSGAENLNVRRDGTYGGRR